MSSATAAAAASAPDSAEWSLLDTLPTLTTFTLGTPAEVLKQEFVFEEGKKLLQSLSQLRKRMQAALGVLSGNTGKELRAKVEKAEVRGAHLLGALAGLQVRGTGAHSACMCCYCLPCSARWRICMSACMI